MSGFSTHSFRNFKRFIGELTATAAGIHAAVQYAADEVSQMRSEDAWADIAAKYKIKVNGLESHKVFQSASRLNIVNIYSGFDLYLCSYRKEYNDLTGKEWKAESQDTPFDEFRKNIALSELIARNQVLLAQIQIIEYYRLARNAIVHPSQITKTKAGHYYISEENSVKTLRDHYGMLSAPNGFDKLNFHDVKLFSRILLDVLPKFDEAVDPGNERLLELIPFTNWVTYTPERKRNAAIGFLKQNYGLSCKRAEEILAH